jgi:hypothetical protein
VEIRELSDAIVRLRCCEDACLLSSLGFHQAVDLVYEIQSRRVNMNRAEKRDDLRSVLQGCISKVNPETGNFRMNWKVCFSYFSVSKNLNLST